MDIWDSGNSLHRQAADPPRTCPHAQRPVGACRDWTHSGPNRSPCGLCLPWYLDSYRNHDADQAEGRQTYAATTPSNRCITQAGKRRRLSLGRVATSRLSIREASRASLAGLLRASFVDSAMSATGPLTPQLLPIWCGAASQRNVPSADIRRRGELPPPQGESVPGRQIASVVLVASMSICQAQAPHSL
jgi:hypothetical protein